jgi:hypothetical protein
MSDGLPVDPLALREEVKAKYRAVAVDPHAAITSTPDGPSRGASATTRRSSPPCRTAPSRLLRVSATRSRSAC